MRALLRLCANVVRFLVWCLLWPARRRARYAPWLWLRLGDRLEEIAPPQRAIVQIRLRGGEDDVRSVDALRAHIRELGRLPTRVGLALHVRSVGAGWATLASAHQALLAVRASGRRLAVFLEEGADQRALYLAAAADEVWVGPSAGVSALGPLARRTFVARLLAKLGVEVGVMAAGDYKSAADGLVRETMSEADREQRVRILAELLADFGGVLGPRLREPVEALHAAAVMSPERALSLGAVDRVGYLDEFEAALGVDKERAVLTPGGLSTHAVRPRLSALRTRPHLAVVRITGAIGSGRRGVELASTRKLLRSLKERSEVAGVVLYIDSPGGSAVTSDLLHREIVQLDGVKPVVAVCGDVAASGGYYLAVGARRIWARATTITGSIGVISVRAAVSALLDRVGVTSESLALTPAADLFRFTTPLSAAEVVLLEAETQRFYTRFLQVVAEGRQRAIDDITKLAGGRVWMGSDAHAHGLVDAIGGLPEALQHLRGELAGLGTTLADEPEYYAARGAGGLVSLVARHTGLAPEFDELMALAGPHPLAYLPRDVYGATLGP